MSILTFVLKMRGDIRARRIFVVLFLALIGAAIFYLNRNHQGQIDTYFDGHKVIGINWWAGRGYTNALGQPMYYPLFGYPMLSGLLNTVSPQGDTWLLVVQYFAALAALVFALWPILNHWRAGVFAVIAIPVFALASVRWPDAWYCIGMMLLARFLALWSSGRGRGWLLACGATAALTVNFRPDLLYFAIGLLLCSAAVYRRLLPFAGALGLGAIIGLAPWIIYTTRETGSPQLSSLNGGHVLYISLGQLPGNPWQREHCDCEGFEYLQSQGVDRWYTPETDQLMKAAALADICAYPEAFVLKVLNNFADALRGGVYAGESIILQRFYTASRFVLLGLIAGGLIAAIFPRKQQPEIILFSACFLLFSLLWVSLLQYEPRHLNTSYAVMLVSLVSLIEKSALNRGRFPFSSGIGLYPVARDC